MGVITAGAFMAGLRVDERLEDGRLLRDVLLDAARAAGEFENQDGGGDIVLVEWLSDHEGLVARATGDTLEAAPSTHVVGVPVLLVNDDDGIFRDGKSGMDAVWAALERARREFVALGVIQPPPSLYLTWSVAP